MKQHKEKKPPYSCLFINNVSLILQCVSNEIRLFWLDRLAFYTYTKITLSVCFDIRASSISLLSIDVIREESSVNTGSITLVAFDDVFHYSIFVL